MSELVLSSRAAVPAAAEDLQSDRWSFGQDSDDLMLSHDMGIGTTCLRLTSTQAATIRALGAATECVRITARATRRVELVLVGKKTGIGLWGGLASRSDDAEGVMAALQKALGFAEQIVSEVNSLVVIIDRNHKVRRFNRLCEEGSGMKEADLIGIDAHKLFLPASHQAEARAHIASFFEKGESYETSTPVDSLLGQRQIQWRNKLIRGSADEDTYVVCSGIDITEELAGKRRLYEQATKDRVTRLPNGLASRQRLEELVDLGLPVAFMTLVVLNYRQLRGMLGLTQSERLMKQVADALVQAVPADWMVSRAGGPEFQLQADGTRSDAELVAVGDEILSALAKTFMVAGVQVHLQAAVGVARFPDHAVTADDLEMAADAAMHAAMTRSRSGLQLYESRMREELAEGLWLDSQLREALAREQLELWYQPKVSLVDGTVETVEALIRWNHPEIGYIAPDRFIPRAEATGIIVEIGRWVMQAAARQAKSWAGMGLSLRVSVNVSAKQVAHDPFLIDALKAAHDHCDGFIDVELTESSFLEDGLAARAFIESSRALGCGVHLDDFGAGYSSLGQLAGLDLTAVKLDRSFIAGGGDSPKRHALLTAISSLAKGLGLEVIAEGVETEEMADVLRRLGVQYAQGWLYSKALPAEVLASWLSQQRPSTAAMSDDLRAPVRTPGSTANSGEIAPHPTLQM